MSFASVLYFIYKSFLSLEVIGEIEADNVLCSFKQWTNLIFSFDFHGELNSKEEKKWLILCYNKHKLVVMPPLCHNKYKHIAMTLWCPFVDASLMLHLFLSPLHPTRFSSIFSKATLSFLSCCHRTTTIPPCIC